MTEKYIYRLSGIIFLMFLYACTDQNTTSSVSHRGLSPPSIVFIADDWSYPHARTLPDCATSRNSDCKYRTFTLNNFRIEGNS